MEHKKKYYRLAIAPYQPILSGFVTDDKKEATQFARENNKIGEYRGRGVRVIQCDANGNPVFKDRK